MSGSWFIVPPPGSDGGRSRRIRRGAALTLVFAGVLATGAATGSWGDELRALAGGSASDATARTELGRGAGTPQGGVRGGEARGVTARHGAGDRAESAGQDASKGAEELVSRSGDRWSAAYTAREYEGLQQSLDGEYVGVGITVKGVHDADGAPSVHVARVQPGSPAAKAGIREGDRLHAIDGKTVRDRPVTEVVARLRGSGSGSDPGSDSGTRAATPPAGEGSDTGGGSGDKAASASPGVPGSRVELELSRGDRTWTEKLRRATLTAESVTVDTFAPGATRIKVSSFTKGTGEEVRRAVQEQVPEGSGILLDLRGNSGGLVNEAVTAASAFLDGGLVATYDEHGAQRALYADHGGDAERPLVVLVDGGTMSAAELLTGALQDRGRAVVVGSRTFGKGTVQMPDKLPDGSVAELTVGHYATPAGRRIDGEGITPDLAIGTGTQGATERARTVLSGLASRS